MAVAIAGILQERNTFSPVETIIASHKPGRLKQGLAMIDGNEWRADMEEAARLAGLDATVNVAVNSQRGTKDTEFMHVSHALHVVNSAPRSIVKRGGTMVILSASSDGFGFHAGGARYAPWADQTALSV